MARVADALERIELLLQGLDDRLERLEHKRQQSRDTSRAHRARAKAVALERLPLPDATTAWNGHGLPYDRWAETGHAYLAKAGGRGAGLWFLRWLVADWNWFTYDRRPFTLSGNTNQMWQGGGTRRTVGNATLFGRQAAKKGQLPDIGFFGFGIIAARVLEAIGELDEAGQIPDRNVQPLQIVGSGFSDDSRWGCFKLSDGTDFDHHAEIPQKVWAKHSNVIMHVLQTCRKGLQVKPKQVSWPKQLVTHFNAVVTQSE